MREILFRGRQKEKPNLGQSGRWSQGYYVKCVFENGYVEHYILRNMPGADGYTLQRNWVEPETVSQWTGFTDRYGEKIFEGDILKYVVPDPPYDDCVGYAEVVWGNGWLLKFKGCSPEESDQDDLGRYAEVVGNRWENAELLEVEA